MVTIILSVLILIAGVVLIKSQSFLFEKPKTEITVEGKFIYRSACELAEMIKKGEATSIDIVKEHIAHIKNNNWKYNAIVWLREKEALEEAWLADELAKKGDTTKPLLGVPVTVKEQFMVKGLPSTLNAKRFGGVIAEKDAAIVSQIKESGAIILGTTNLSLMVSLNETYGEIYPTGNNPYDTSLTCGGSSGGEAVALSAGFTTLSLGGDAAGSVRIPSAFCGVYGLKPSFGLLNITDGVMPFELMKGKKFGLAVAGPLARDIDDLKFYFDLLIKTTEKNDQINQLKRVENNDRDINDYKIAWIDEWQSKKGKMTIGRDVKNSINDLVKKLEDNDVYLKKDCPDIYDEMVKVWGGMLFQITSQDESLLVRKILKMIIKRQDNFSGNFESIYESLDDQSDERWVKLVKDQKVLSDKMESFFKDYDFLIIPLTYGPAYKKTKNANKLINDEGELIHYFDYFPYTAIFNATGNPAIVIPVGLNENGLPIGLQIVGPMFSDYALIDFVKKIEHLIRGFRKPENI